MEIARILGKLSSKSSIETLVSMLSDQNEDLRVSAAKILGQIKDGRTVESLAEVLQDENAKVANAAAFALASMGDNRAVSPLIDLLRTERKMVPVRIGMNPDVYQDEDMNRFVRVDAAKALGKLNDASAIEPLADALNDPAVDFSAAAALARLGDDRGLNRLLEMLVSDDERFRQHRTMIITAVGVIGATRAVEPLLKMLDLAETPETLRASILTALGQIKTPEAIDAIKTVMNSCGRNAIDAADELAKIGYDCGFDFLRSELNSDEERRRLLVTIKLRYLHSPRVVEMLISALEDDSVNLRMTAVHRLGHIVTSVRLMLCGIHSAIRTEESESPPRLHSISWPEAAGDSIIMKTQAPLLDIRTKGLACEQPECTPNVCSVHEEESCPV